MQPASGFQAAERSQRSILTTLEKRALLWLAQRLPSGVKSDHLTLLGFLSLIAVGLSYWYSHHSRAGLWLVILFLILNWFGDSLDGTLARVRKQQRPRYGFYVDHVLDACGSVFVFVGLALSGYMSERIALGLLVVYLLLSVEAYLATYTVGKFRLSFAAFGPTELRVLLIAGNVALLCGRVQATLAGGKYLLFDVGGAIGIAGMVVALVWSMVRHTAQLYRSEPLPGRKPSKSRPMLLRWLRFNAVGMGGFAIQLGALWLLARVARMPDLVATALAVEIAVLNNFVWHEAWTWRGLGTIGRWQRFVRFHIANGFVSIGSNVLLTAILMQWAGLPLLWANTAAVAMTALLNFALAEAWVFAADAPFRSRF